jgi:hypothetical protein
MEHASGDAGKLARAIQVAQSQKVQAQQKLAEHQQVQQQMYYGKMQEAMLETAKAIPGWMDNGQINQPKVQADHSKWASVLGPEYGITEMDVANVLDHRYVRMLKDLAELKTKVGKATPEKLKAMRKPKLATTLKQLSARRGNLGKTNDERARALRRKETRKLADHDPRKIESLRDVWNARR